MCGIGGFSISKRDQGRINPDELAGALLMGLEARGRHATGQAWVEGGHLRSRKAAVPASTWVKRGEHHSTAFTRILHTRYATQGDPANPLNNHPIRQGTVIGTHNGTLDYGHDDDLFDLLKCERHGEVDSEAIFALLAHGQMATADALELVRGRAAIAWFDSRDKRETLHVARLHGSPLAVGQTRGGSFIYASTMEILLEACAHVGVTLVWKQDLPEGQYIRVQGGTVVSCEVFDTLPAAPRVRGVSNRGTWVFGTGAASSSKPAAKAKAKGKAKSKRAVTRAERTIAGWSRDERGVWTEDRHVYTADEWDWDDADALAEAEAAAEEAVVFGE